jgi:hypothetical protein
MTGIISHTGVDREAAPRLKKATNRRELPGAKL